MSILISENSREIIQALLTGRSQRVTGVVYRGPTLERATIVWGVEVVMVAAAGVVGARFVVAHDTNGYRGLPPTFVLESPAAGERMSAGGLIVGRLKDGDVLGLYGSCQVAGIVAVEANGFTVRIL